MRGIGLATILVCTGTTVMLAQSAPSSDALAQVRQVQQALTHFSAPDSARAAGFESVFGWLPTMGTHWVDNRRMDNPHFDLLRPDNLMFSPVGGKETLVGVAYAYFADVADTARPATFAGNPAWHEHANLAPPGKTLAMLHVWFVPSPDGPFAGHNPNLPYWALGLTPPDAERMRDPQVSSRMRRTALALAEIVDTAGVFPNLARRAVMQAVLPGRRAAIRVLIPELDAAQKAGDWARWDRAADRAAAEWDALREAYIAAVLNPAIRERVVKLLDEMTTGTHGDMHHH